MNDKQLIEWVIKDLETNPEKWRFDSYEAMRIERPYASVWMVNRYYGTEVTVSGYRVGGVTGWSSFFSWLPSWRERVVRAARNAALRNAGIE